MQSVRSTCVSLSGAVILLFTNGSAAQDWQPYQGEENLQRLVSGTVLERMLRDDVKAVGRYHSDGTGVLEAWGESFPRQWEIRGDTQICVQFGQEEQCSTFEKATDQEDLFRATVVGTGEIVEFSLREGAASATGDTQVTGAGGAVEPSAAEIAKSLANPNTPLASQTLKFQYRLFDGDLPGASDESGTMLLYQPTFPFPLDNGASIFFRPAFPVMFDQPVYDVVEGDFDSESGLGDIGFDLVYGRTTETGFLWALGVVSTLPTATEDTLGADRWSLGPEILIGKSIDKVVLGALAGYQTDIAGSGDADVSLTTVNAWFTYLPGGGWNVSTAPIMSYDHENSQWTLPLNLTVGKTVIWNGRPWKLSAEVNYFVEQPDAFGPDWMFGINIAPVVENVFARMFR